MMINPNKLEAKYSRWNEPGFAGGKYYLPYLTGLGYTRACRRIFARASEAETYAELVKARWIRLYDAAIRAMVSA